MPRGPRRLPRARGRERRTGEEEPPRNPNPYHRKPEHPRNPNPDVLEYWTHYIHSMDSTHSTYVLYRYCQTVRLYYRRAIPRVLSRVVYADEHLSSSSVVQ